MWEKSQRLETTHMFREFPIFQKPKVIKGESGEVDRARSPREVCARHERLAFTPGIPPTAHPRI